MASSTLPATMASPRRIVPTPCTSPRTSSSNTAADARKTESAARPTRSTSMSPWSTVTNQRSTSPSRLSSIQRVPLILSKNGSCRRLASPSKKASIAPAIRPVPIGIRHLVDGPPSAGHEPASSQTDEPLTAALQMPNVVLEPSVYWSSRSASGGWGDDVDGGCLEPVSLAGRPRRRARRAVSLVPLLPPASGRRCP
jgi:hypothetical protein